MACVHARACACVWVGGWVFGGGGGLGAGVCPNNGPKRKLSFSNFSLAHPMKTGEAGGTRGGSDGLPWGTGPEGRATRTGRWCGCPPPPQAVVTRHGLAHVRPLRSVRSVHQENPEAQGTATSWPCRPISAVPLFTRPPPPRKMQVAHAFKGPNAPTPGQLVVTGGGGSCFNPQCQRDRGSHSPPPPPWLLLWGPLRGGRKHIQQHRAGLQQGNSVLEP